MTTSLLCYIDYFSLTFYKQYIIILLICQNYFTFNFQKGKHCGGFPLSDPHRGRTVWFIFRSPFSPVFWWKLQDSNLSPASQMPCANLYTSISICRSDNKQYSTFITLKIQERKENLCIKASFLNQMGIEPIYFSWKENVITIRLLVS